MNLFTVDYRRRDGAPRGQLVNVGFFAHGLPRLMPLCRLAGHKPVVDGTTGLRAGDPGCRWVCCDRCGVRGEPQGDLDPAVHAVGGRYLGPWADSPPPTDTLQRWLTDTDRRRGYHPPGLFPARPRGALGGQFLLGRTGSGEFGFELKVGNAGSEHTLAATLRLGHLATLHLHTERFGTGVQRWLNPTGYDSRLIGLTVSLSGVRWRLWSKRDGLRAGADAEPWWRNGEIRPRLLDRTLGPRRYTYTDVGQRVGRLVRMPEGDYLVSLQLQRCTLGRRRGRKRASWSVDWQALGAGIPTKGPGRGRIYGSAVDVAGRAVTAGTWPAEAAAAVASSMTAHRTRYEWEPLGRVPVAAEAVPA